MTETAIVCTSTCGRASAGYLQYKSNDSTVTDYFSESNGSERFEYFRPPSLTRTSRTLPLYSTDVERPEPRAMSYPLGVKDANSNVLVTPSHSVFPCHGYMFFYD